MNNSILILSLKMARILLNTVSSMNELFFKPVFVNKKNSTKKKNGISMH